jgi:hypothetical protein
MPVVPLDQGFVKLETSWPLASSARHSSATASLAVYRPGEACPVGGRWAWPESMLPRRWHKSVFKLPMRFARMMAHPKDGKA